MSEPTHPIYRALVKVGTVEMTVRPSVLTREKYAALLDAPAVHQHVGPLASDEQRARRASEVIKEAVEAIVSPRDRLIGEAVLCTQEAFAGLTVGERKYALADWPQMQITHDIYREARLRVLEWVYRWLASGRRRGISGVSLLMGVARAGIALHYASLAEVFRLEHNHEDVGASQQTWQQFADVSTHRVFGAFLTLVMCEQDVSANEQWEELAPTSPTGSIQDLHSLVNGAFDAGPLEYHHIEAARGMRLWPRSSPPPVDIYRYLYTHVWQHWYNENPPQRARDLLAASTPFAGYSDKYEHAGAVFTHRAKLELHEHFAALVPGYVSATGMASPLCEQLHEFFNRHSTFPDLTEDEYEEQLSALVIFDMESNSVS